MKIEQMMTTDGKTIKEMVMMVLMMNGAILEASFHQMMVVEVRL